jgi:hypothetical protein
MPAHQNVTARTDGGFMASKRERKSKGKTMKTAPKSKGKRGSFVGCARFCELERKTPAMKRRRYQFVE